MFDITSSKLLILGIIALIVVGPKDLPLLLRTIGSYVAMIRRQANEFKAQFDDAMRETELDKLKKEVEQVGQAAESSISETERSINNEIARANSAIDQNIAQPLETVTESAATVSVDAAPPVAAAPIPVTDAAPLPTFDAAPLPTLEPTPRPSESMKVGA
jgi:sec-independent protein translocase protein TatB